MGDETGSSVSEKRNHLVGIVMGSDSDFPVMKEAVQVLKEFGVPFAVRIISAHRTPDVAATSAKDAMKYGLKVLIAGAGWAAHLAGALASNTTLPVIAVPIDSSPLNGMDALLSTVQMPPGVPVATMAIGKGGAKNAALFAIQILALSDQELAGKLSEYRRKMGEDVSRKNRLLEESLQQESK